MSDTISQWFTQRASLPGTLAGAVRGADGQCLTHSADPACPTTSIESVLANFDSLTALCAEASAPQWSTWVFEQGQIRLVERPDGGRLALAVRNETDAAAALDAASQEFLTLSFEA